MVFTNGLPTVYQQFTNGLPTVYQQSLTEIVI